MTREVIINKKVKIGANNKIVIIAGPCVIESKELCFEVASELSRISNKLELNIIFKSSYDKANRTSIKSFRGPGLKKGLKILAEVKEKFNLPILSDVHCTEQVKPATEVLDVIQIPAFLSRQTDLIITAAKTQKVINIKKGQFLSPYDMKYVIEKITSTGNHNILLTERGTTFGYNNLVVDFTSLPIMRSFSYPVIFDATHSLQLPAAAAGTSGGRAQFIPYLSRAAAACIIDGLFLEVHPQPSKALSDKENSLQLDKLEELLLQIKKIDKEVKKYQTSSTTYSDSNR